jgi:DNA polymerase-3 subunit epsilon
VGTRKKIGIRDGDELHVLDRWCYLVSAKHEADID